MIVNQDRAAGAPPHGLIFATVIAIVVFVPFLLGDGGVTEAISELLTPVGLLLVVIALLLTIQFLSSDQGRSIFAGIFPAGEPDTIHRASGSPAGVAIFLAVLLFLLYTRVSIFGGGDDDSGD